MENREGPGARPRAGIAAFIVTCNEEHNIRQCLQSVAFCDEIVVIDSFSTDQTVEIARECGARVIQRAWPGYREQKAFGLGATTREWVINLDADERVSEELRAEVLTVLEAWAVRRAEVAEIGDDEIVGYFVNRVVYHLGRWWRLGGWYPEWRLRFFRRDNTTWGGIDPHEKAVVAGRTGRLQGELEHYTYRSLSEQFSRLERYSTLAAEEEFRGGRRAQFLSLLFNPFLRSFKFLIWKRGFREGTAGLIVAVAEGYYTFMKYAKLWELEFRERERGRKQ